MPIPPRFERLLFRGCLCAALCATALVPACATRSSHPVESAPGAAASAEPATPAGAAVELYDQGKYDEAKLAIEELQKQGPLSGPMLYRLGFTYGQARDMARQNELMQQALTELEKEAATGDDLEVAFFRANALGNLGRTPEAQSVASAATAKIESGKWPKPKSAIELFRAGKLYQDQNRRDDAVSYYRQALAGWQSTGVPAPGYQRWALRYLAQDAPARADVASAEADLEALTSLGGALPSDWDRLAVLRVKQRDWKGAQSAWREAEKLDPANADRPRYCRNLAALAETAGEIPHTAPSGAAWSTIAPKDLETMMAEQAKVLRDARTEAAAGIAPERKAELQRNVEKARATFVGAAFEYAGRYLELREAAFTGGYAPLIFHPDEWTAEPPQQPQP